MNSYKTIEEARAAAATNSNVLFTVEIVPGQPNIHKYINVMASVDFLRKQLKRKPMKEISEILDLPVGTVKSRLFYGRKALKKKLQSEGRGLREVQYEFT